MKKTALLASCLIALFGISSCVKEKIDITEPENDDVRRVEFLAHMEEDVDVETRSGLLIKSIFTWVNTDPKNVHLFEKNNSNGEVIEGEDVTITTEDPYDVATFSAGFYNSVIINPETKAATKSYTYTGIVAQKDGGKYVVPSVQYPQTDSKIDPDADFLIGISPASYSNLNGKSIDFKFDRAIATSRLAITNLEGTYIKSVTITSDDDLTGSAGYNDIDFDQKTVDFSNGSKTLKIVFADGTKKSSTTYAYFTSIFGKKHINTVEIETDEWVYTKTVDKNTTFSKGKFLHIALDMTLDETCTRKPSSRQPLKFMKSEKEIVSDTWDLASEGQYVSPTLTGAVEGATISYESSAPEVATAELVGDVLVVTPLAIGEAIITATASAVEAQGEDPAYDETSISYTLTVSDSSVPVDQTLEFSEDEIAHTYGESFTEPELTGAYTTVTYAVTDGEDVASVNASTGKVTFAGVAGTVTITATAAAGTIGDVTYNEGSASYTITVTVSGTDVVLNNVTEVKNGGMYVMVYNGKALKKNGSALDDPEVTVSQDNSKVTFDSSTDLTPYIWTWTSSDLATDYGSYSVTNGTDWLYFTTSGSSSSKTYTLSVGSYDNDYKSYSVWTYSDKQVRNGKSSYMRYLVCDDGWSHVYKTSSAGSEPDHDFYLYEYIDQRTPQTLSFGSTAPEIDLASTTTYTQTVTGAQTAVTYAITASSAEGVATINSTSGQVSASKKGTITVTATAAGDATYQPASASYTLTIKNSAATTTTYYKHTKAVVGKEYIIVSNGYAFKNNSGTIAAEAVTVTSDQIELDDASAILWTAGTPSYTDYNGFTYSNNGKYIKRSSSALSLDSEVSSKYFNFDYTSEGYFKSGSSSYYYVYYDSADGWKASSSSSSSSTSRKVTLYCAEKPASYTYTKVATATTSLADGTYLIVNPDGAKALDGSSTGTSNTVSVSPVSGVINGDFSANEFEIKKTDDGYTIKSVAGSKYLYYDSSASSTRMGYQSDKAYFSIETGTKDESLFYLSNGTSSDKPVYIYYSSSYFKFGTSGSPTSSDAGVILYKKAATE